MKFYISQMVETEKILPILRKYDVGVEVVQFANPYVLDHRYEIMDEYKRELKELYNNVDLIIHGPYADLCPGSRDNEIKRVTKLRMEQAFEVANSLGAKKFFIIMDICQILIVMWSGKKIHIIIGKNL